MPFFSLATIPHLARNARRFKEIAGVLAKYGLAEFLSATDPSFFKDHLVGPAGAALPPCAARSGCVWR